MPNLMWRDPPLIGTYTKKNTTPIKHSLELYEIIIILILRGKLDQIFLPMSVFKSCACEFMQPEETEDHSYST